MPRKSDDSATSYMVVQESPDSTEQGDRCKTIRVTASQSNRNESRPKGAVNETGNPPRCNPRIHWVARPVVGIRSIS